MSEYHVAIAEDNPQMLNLLNDMLEEENGFRVVGKADNGVDAYNMIVDTNPDLVLMDVIMPKLDGISVMEKVRKEKTGRKVPSFIMVTAAGSDQVTRDAFRLGASYFIMKPFQKELVMDKIRRVCAGSEKNLPYAENEKINPYMDRNEYIRQNLGNTD